VTPLSFDGFWRAIARMERDGTLPEWAADHQERSRASRERALASAYELIADEGPEAFTMEATASRAGLSIGALYDRFPSREAVLALLGMAVMEEAAIEIDRAVSQTDSATECLRAYVTTMVRLFRRRRAVIRTIRASRTGNPELARFVSQGNERIHGRIRDRLRTGLPEPLHERLEYALFMSSAAAREGVLYDALASYGADADDERLAVEIHRAATAYLGIMKEHGAVHPPSP